MDHLSPADLVTESVAAASKKAGLTWRDMLLRGALSGAILGFATSLALVIGTQGLPGIAGAIAFPIGFVILVLLGLELATGNFALLPQGVAAGKVSLSALGRSWLGVYVGNLMGSLVYAVLFYAAITYFGTSDAGPLGAAVTALAQKKTLAYAAHGAAGWGTALVKGVLCNWMVTLGSVLALVSRSTIGKIVAMWLPITIFFAHGYEHSVVNMYVIPSGMLLGAPIRLSDWLFWNQLPVTLGNIVGGVVFTGLALWMTFGARAGRGEPSGGATPGTLPGTALVGTAAATLQAARLSPVTDQRPVLEPLVALTDASGRPPRLRH